MASNSNAAHVLMKKGKRGAAAYVHADCSNSSSPQHLSELLDIILNPGKPIEEWETIDWIKWLMAGGKTPDEFASIVRRYDNATTCGLVWTANFVAYRCRTCGISPCMSLCAECFQKGNHVGHDFNMFRSQAGGACDCGDTSVMKEMGFCDRHGPKAQVNKPSAPTDLMCVAEAIMPRIILRLLQHLREHSKSGIQDAYLVAIQDADLYLTMLHDFSAMGAAMRRVMTGALTNPQIYKHLTECFSEDSEYYSYMLESQRVYHEALKSLPNPEPPEEYKDCPSLQEQLIHRTFLEELVFWTVKFEFPQKVVCLLLNMLPDPDYKEALTEAFVLHYSRISMMLERSADPDTLSNRVVHVSVQLFSNECLAFHMAENLNLLHVMVISLKYMMAKILIPNTLHDPSKNSHFVVDCGRHVMKEHCYWPLVSDLNNVLSHRPVAIKFMSDDNLLEMWFGFLSMFQGMNVNQRELTQHVEFEPNTYYAAFSAELEASAYPMWALACHLVDCSTVELTRNVLSICRNALQEWLDAVGFTSPKSPDGLQVSFHLPLHRYLSVFMCQAIRLQGLTLREVLPPPDLLSLIMMHPLRVQVAFYEILSGMWVRNGLQIKGQAMTYIQCNFCNSMVDADLYLLQICATQLPPENFLMTVLEKFHIMEWMSLGPFQACHNSYVDGEHDAPMLESCMTFLATLTSIRTNLGLPDASLSQLEMVTLLCMGDKTHSQLIELMPERCGTAQSRDFESVLAEVAEYKAPNLEASGHMQQGMYVPRPVVWEQLYDPIHVLLRAVHRRDFQTSMDRFGDYVHQAGKLKSASTPWPPFREPAPCHEAYEDPRKILRSRVFHSAAFVVLHKAVVGHTVSEHVMSIVIYLLEMAVVTAEHEDQQSQVCQASRTSRKKTVKDKELASWYDSDWLSENLRTVIHQVRFEPEPAVVFDSSDSEIEWESSEMDGDPEMNGESSGAVPVLGSGEDLTVSVVQDLSVVTHPINIALRHATRTPRPARPSSSSQHAAVLSGTEIVPSAAGTSSQAVVPAGSVHTPEFGPHGPVESQPSLEWNPSISGNEVVPAGTSFNSEVVPSTSGTRKVHLKKRKQGKAGGKSCGDCLDRCLKEEDDGYYPSYVSVNESIISLLLKLHSQLSGTPDSFNPDEVETPEMAKSRIGDGPVFIGKLLRRIAALDTLCRENIRETRNQIWPQKEEEREAAIKAQEAKEREERRRRAKERQQKLMAEFATKQKQFMERAMETDEGASGMDWNEEESTTLTTSKKEYDCVICNQTSPSTEEKPMGQVVLVQASSVLAHKRRSAEPAFFPTCDEERQSLRRDDNFLGSEFDRRVEDLNAQFDCSSWQLSVNIGWDGGVHIQTCGHHLHLDCLKSYLQSLRNQQRQQSLAVDRGEYWCPLCRQLANSVLPLSPQLGECSAIVRSRPSSLLVSVAELTVFLKDIQPINLKSSNIMEAMGKSMEDMTNSTHHKFKQKSHSTTPESLFLFVNSVARTNLEIELVQRGGSLVLNPNMLPGASNASPAGGAQFHDVLTTLIPKRSCVVPLLHVLAVHSRVLVSWPAWKTWQQVAGVQDSNSDPLALLPAERTVPLLLHDPSALLTQFVLLLPLHLDQASFACVVKIFYNLLYMQVVAQLTCSMKEAERARWRRIPEPTDRLDSLDAAFALTVQQLDRGRLYLEDSVELNPDEGDENNASGLISSAHRQHLESQLQTLCLPFLRLAALLRHHLYEQPLPEITSPQEEFVRLVYYLELVAEGMEWGRFSAAVALNWPTNGAATARAWCEQMAAFAARSQVSARNFLAEQHLSWHQPRLLRLPQLYDKIFQYYHRRQCSQCHSVPRETSICLLCGTLVCLKESCCKQLSTCEAVQHSIDCGGGTAMYLVVTSSYIIVIRGKRACLWGSVYLDSFGEEDRELKRGKPLYLSDSRYQLLEQQWLAHRFDHTNKKWVWHRDAL
ncbi:E3 ubiquitin-protein ligase Ubr3 isoform X1 [Schistocerca gregaria]|uniref:E3 ubiquitin-protein ligase Ubr3 isoform X1 n=1 Tax=Schistocerca gregaria TaxID=7010 RepID=UPI00211ED35A|nr:E3 ubiquitin-protein ligase Ubr3 isoform X1 [Schistocerca gregaria]